MTQNTTAQAGVLIIDKPLEWTSHDAVARVRKLSGLRRVGHTGTLDPLATGLLIVVLGQATRLIQFSHEWQKTYEAEITLGSTSTTDDAGGVVTKHEIEQEPSAADIASVVSRFIGPIKQMPPTYAAIKLNGKKLYQYARAGETVVVEPRDITIHDIEIISYEFPKIKVRVVCSTGTYIRSLARDLGEALNTGAYITALRRTRIGALTVEQSAPLDELSTATLPSRLSPPETLISHLQRTIIDGDNVAKWKQGVAIPIHEQLPEHHHIAVYNSANTLLGIGERKEATPLLSPTIVLN